MKNNKEVWSNNNASLQVGDYVKVVRDIKYPTVTIGQGVTGIITSFTDDNRPQINSKSAGKFICESEYLDKVHLTHLEKEVIKLLKDIKYQTGYMTNSWGDNSMLSQMAIEDKISPWSIESEVEKFAKKHDLKL